MLRPSPNADLFATHPFSRGHPQHFAEDDNDPEEEEHTIDLTTPTFDAIVTPISLRRARRQMTPSRLNRPANINRSLFNSATPTPSPLRKARAPGAQMSRALTIGSVRIPEKRDAEPGPVAPDAVSFARLGVQSRSTPARGRSLTQLDQKTPSTSGSAHSSGGNAATSDAKTMQPQSRSVLPSPGPRPRPPRRAAKPSPATTLSDSGSPQTCEAGSSHNAASVSPLGSQMPVASQSEKPAIKHENGTTIQIRKRKSVTTLEIPAAVDIDQSHSGELDDADLVKKLHEHNRRIRKSGRHVVGFSSDNVRKPVEPCKMPTQASDQVSAEKEEQKGSEEGGMAPSSSHARHRSEGTVVEPSKALNDLLQSGNDKIIQLRKERQAERTKMWQKKRASVLKSHGGLAAGQQTRTVAKVEFTSATAPSKPSMNPLILDKRKAPPGKARGIRGAMSGFQTRAKSTGVASSARVQGPGENRTARFPLISRNGSTKLSIADQVKAKAKQKREEKRMENDLQSMLSQHNSRVQSTRRGHA